MNTLIYHIAKNCDWLKTVNDAFIDQCEGNLDKLEQMLPHGSGIDAGCKIDRENSGKYGVTIHLDFHHMDEMGGYDGWTQHKAVINPTLTGIDLKITGKDKNGIIEYLNDTLYDCLTQEIEFK